MAATAAASIEPALAAPSHWDEFYAHAAKPDVAEYMLPYSRIASYLDSDFLGIAVEEARFLVVGCGISALGEELYDSFAGRMQEVMNVDISAYCVEHLRRRSLQRPRMRFAVEDMSHSSLPSSSYDIVVDKGVLDDLLAFTRFDASGAPSREAPTDAGERAACAMLWDIRRVLVEQGGVYLCAGVHGPERLDSLLRSSALGFASVEHFDLGGGEVGHHLHVCRTQSGGSSNSTHEHEGGFERYVADVLHRKYTEVMPLLTPERAAAVRALFAPSCDGTCVRRRAGELYAEAFIREERGEYPLSDFLEDLSSFLAQRQAQPLATSAGAAEGRDDGGASSSAAGEGAGEGAEVDGAAAAPALGPDVLLSCEEFLDFLQAAQ